jgi:hypothetical protein
MSSNVNSQISSQVDNFFLRWDFLPFSLNFGIPDMQVTGIFIYQGLEWFTGFLSLFLGSAN